MLEKHLNNDESMAGRSVEMTITATGNIVDAYDVYLDIYAYEDHKSGDEYHSYSHRIFVRLLFWETTHKQIVIGSVNVLDTKGFSDGIVKEIEMISTPIEKKDYWKKMFEKYLVVELAKLLENACGELTRMHNTEKGMSAGYNPNLSKVAVHSCSIASYEYAKRNLRETANGVEVLNPGYARAESDCKCWDGPHGFVRSDSADDFELKPTSMPVSVVVK